jgi:hypothetical protein
MNSFLYAQNYRTIYISTNKSESSIYINGQFIGKGEVKNEILTDKIVLRIVEDEKIWGAREIIDSIYLSPNDSVVSKSYFFEDRILVTSSPDDAIVYSDDAVIGYTPLSLLPDAYNLSLKKKYFKHFILKLDETKFNTNVELEFIGEIENEKFINTNWFKVLMGSAVALGATAAYFKLKADKNYDKYQETKDKMYLDKTNRQDIYSGIALGLLQINFGVLVYYFVFD